MLFTAGNDGHISRIGNIISPSTSKNILTVGASMNTNEATIKSIDYLDLTSGIKNAITYANVSTPEECCNYNGGSKYYVWSNCCPSNVSEVYSINKFYYNEKNVAFYSSRG
jgi:hypothetical protein